MQPTVHKIPKAAPMTIVKNKVEIKAQYADVFEGVGCFPGQPYHIQVDQKVPPKQTPVRPVPVHLKEAFKQELDKMLQAAYIKPVHEATPWINSYVIVEGKDKLGRLKIRICLDPTNFNVAVIREPWFSKTPDDIAHMLADAVIITATDCTKGFWYEALDEESSYLTTFGTEFGRFRFTVQIRQATQDDDTMALLQYTITFGWPNTVQELPKELQAYWTFREEMTVEDGLILKATRIVIPPTLRESTLQQLHEGHLGFIKCYNRAKQTVYWPNLRKELEDLVLNCQLCLKHSQAKRRPKPTPSFGQEIPAVPWTKLASDIFHFQNDSYLLIVDFTSRFPVVRKLTSMTAKHVASHFSQVFSEYGWPDTLLTDNGPCYTAQDFKQLMMDMSVNHITSSPHYPQSNGLAEKYVQIVKNLFIKAYEEGTDYQKALMIYRNTPLDDNLLSPMQLLQGRAARSDLPMSYAAQVKHGLASGHSLPP